MRIIQYIKDTRNELKHVSWPTQRQTIVFTAMVILLSVVTALYLGAFDYILSEMLSWII